MVRSIKRGNVTVRVRRETEIRRGRATNGRVAPAERILEPKSAHICHFPQVRRNRRIAFEHFVQHAAFVGFTEYKDDVVRSRRFVFMLRSITVSWIIFVRASTCEIGWQESVQVMNKFIGNGVTVTHKFKSFKSGDMQNRCRQRVFPERKAPVDLRFDYRNCRNATGPRQEQDQRKYGKGNTHNKHGDWNFLVLELCNPQLHRGHAFLAHRINDTERNSSYQSQYDYQSPEGRPETVTAKRRNRRRVRDVRDMQISADKRIRKALVVEAENFVIDNRKDEIKYVKNGKCPRALQERKNGGHHKDGSIRHENLPDGLTRIHLGHRKSQRIGQGVEQHEHHRLQQERHKRNQYKRIFKKLFDNRTQRKIENRNEI